MNILSQQDMIAREEAAFKSGLTAEALMEAAGEAMARRITALYPYAREFLVLTGKGNNGGDGLVVARHLILSGREVRVVLTLPEAEISGLPKIMLGHLRRAAPDLEIGPWKDDLSFPGSDSVVIDALLGLQAKGTLRGTLAGIVTKVNEARARNFFRTIALDFPSGLAAYEEGPAPQDGNAAVMADVTLAVGFAKEALSQESLAAWVGRLDVVPWRNAEATLGKKQILVGHELVALLPRRNALSHKNDFGRLVIVAGSPGFAGAPVLCAQAAQAMGVGLLSVVTRPEVMDIVAAQAPPEAMISGWPHNDDVPAVVRNASAIVIGPGLGVDETTVKLLRTVLAMGYPLLIDADGLNALSKNPDLLREAKGPVVLTPHPGEMTRLIGRKFSPDERESVAREFSAKHNVTLVLKGTRTIITAPGQPIFINTTGNPGLSTGGSGDTLSGIIGALLAQGLKAIDAARLGVWLHGHAADLALDERGCEEGLTPTMVSAHLGAALVSLRADAMAAQGLLERANELLGQAGG